jgi:hypothetical protein
MGNDTAAGHSVLGDFSPPQELSKAGFHNGVRKIPSLFFYLSRPSKSGWLVIYGFTFRSRIFHWYGDVTIAGEGLQNLGLCSALRAFEQGWIFIVPHLLWHGTSVFPVSSEGPPIQSPLTTHEGMWRIYSNPDPHGGEKWMWQMFIHVCNVLKMLSSHWFSIQGSICCIFLRKNKSRYAKL